MPTNDMEDHKDIVGVQIGLSLDSLTDWEFRKSHEDVLFLHTSTSGKRTKKEHLVVKRTEVKVLSELVSLSSASGCTTLFVHACTPGVQFE